MIVVSNRPWVTDDQSIVPKPTFFFGDVAPDDLTYQRRYFQFSYTVDGEERTVFTRSTFDCTVLIMSLSPTCSKREDPPSWAKRTDVIKTGVFVAGSSGYAKKSPVHMDMLMLASIYQGVSESLLSAHLRIRRFRDDEIGQSSVKLSPDLRKKAFDFGVCRDSTRSGSGRHYSLTNAEKAWLFNIRVGTMVYCKHLFIDIQPYVPSRFALQFGFSQDVVGVPSSKVKRFGGLQDGRNAWAFYSAEDTTAMISNPELPTFRTVGFTKWFVESFSMYPGLSKKELDVKQSPGKGLGRSDGVRREEVLAFLSGEKHKIGFLYEQDVIR
ncbi:hypothetical protein AAC387_Pa05g1106 [Persea americana]